MMVAHHRDDFYDVIIVGAGVAGTSAAYHLAKYTSNVLVIESSEVAGEGGRCGSADGGKDDDHVINYTECKSGSATMPCASTIKMMVQVFACGSQDFVKHHGVEGARRYMVATKQGLVIQKQLAKEIQKESREEERGEVDDGILLELGSFYVGYENDRQELEQEYEFFKSLGDCCENIQFYNEEQLHLVPGCSKDFSCAIYFPSDAIVDSSKYSKLLLKRSRVSTLMNTRVSNVVDHGKRGSIVKLGSGQEVFSKHVVWATGGLHPIPEIQGLLQPCYSYLAHVPVDNSRDESSLPSTSANFFTWGFTHDWSMTGGKVRVSGEDHFSAYEDPRFKERCANLIRWTQERYKCTGTSENEQQSDFDYSNIPQQYGVYSETPDHVPLVGMLHENSSVCYLLGCNAWGQAILSYAASLVPGLLGYDTLSDDQSDCVSLLDIKRFAKFRARI